MQKKYKILISDYDGTLAKDDKTVSYENLEAVKGFINRGGIFAVSTGRMTAGIARFLKDYGLNCLVSAFNGGEIVDLKSGEILFSNPVDKNTAIKFFEFTEKYNINSFAYPNGKVLGNKNSKFIDAYCSVLKVKSIKVDSIVEFIKNNDISTPKLYVIDEKKVVDKYFNLIKSTFNNLEVVRSEDERVDINVKGGTKGEACKIIANHFGLTLDDVIGVGDSGNDISMLKAVGLPIAVENAYKEVKDVAKIIAPSNNENAIKYIIDNYCI